MKFKFGKGNKSDAPSPVVEVETDEERDLVLFQGPVNGREVKLQAHGKLVEAGLMPAKELVTDALSRRAETFRIDPKGERAAVTLLIDGVAYPSGRLPKMTAMAVTQMLKLLSGLNVKVRSKPQRGGIKAEFDGTSYELSIEATPVKGGGERLTLRAVDVDQPIPTPAILGFTDDLKLKIRELTSHDRGLLLVCGPPRSGTTTTTFAVLMGVDPYLFAMFTIADVGGRELRNITPLEGEPGDDLETRLLRLIRAEAAVTFVDPIQDAEIAKTLFSYSEKLTIIGEFASKDAAHGVMQLVKWVGNPQLVADGLAGVFSQKLVRLLCDDCKEAYRPNPKLINKVGLPPETKTLYRPPRPPQEGDPPREPCEKCSEIGYRGRTAMIELIEMTDSIKQLVAQGATVAAVNAQARKEKMQTVQQDGLRLIAEGKTSLEELQRVFRSG